MCDAFGVVVASRWLLRQAGSMCWFALLRLVERDAVVRLIDAYAEMLCETRRQLLAAASRF